MNAPAYSKLNMITGLEEIRDYVLSEMNKQRSAENQLPSAFEIQLSTFLNRLMVEEDGDFKKDPYSLKAGRQLLCCIGIDLLSGHVPAEHYLRIFEATDLLNNQKEARQLFWESCKNNNLLYKECGKKMSGEYNVIICPIHDWEYYVDKGLVGMLGSKQAEYVHEKLKRLEKNGALRLSADKFYKGTDYGHFWITTEEHILELIESNNPTTMIVDQLGLSHFDFNQPHNRYFFKIKIGKATFETFKPNATIVEWTNPKTGFLSFGEDETGRTFSISGYQNYKDGLKERVFNSLTLVPEEVASSSLSTIPPGLVLPLEIECEQLIQEGITRFKKTS